MFFIEHTDAPISADIKALGHAYSDANTAGRWWPHRQFVIVSDRPTSVHREQVAPSGWDSHQLHNEDGPAVEFADGWAIHAWHGLRVPAWVIETPTPERIAAEPNAEIRRAAIESYGWDRFIDDAGLALVDSDPDPLIGSLYDVPDEIYGEPVRVLLVENGTPNLDGSPLRYGMTVPDRCATVREAQNWMAGLTSELVLERRT